MIRDVLIKWIDAYLQRANKAAGTPNPAERRIAERRAADRDERRAARKEDKTGAMLGTKAQAALAASEAEPMTRLMSSRGMVDTLVNEMLNSAGMPAELRRVKLYNLSEDQSVDGQFVLMVNFKEAIPDVWEHLPALGQHIAKQINSRLDVKVGNVYWSLAKTAIPLTKMPPAWHTNRLSPVALAGAVSAAVGGVASAMRRT